ncbi:xylosidase/arabinosidase [Minicystis rosea]|nr:xylosidase/arabinosidase [Minicystis rosea]
MGLACFLGVVLGPVRAAAMTAVMVPWSGSDGVFDTITLDGKTVYQSKSQGGGSYSSFMYFKRPTGVDFIAGAPLYMEVDFKDLGGTGKFGAQYDAVGNDFQTAGFVIGSSVQGTGTYRTAVFQLDQADLHGAQNGGQDLRLTQPGPLQLHIVEVRVSDTPTALYQQQTSFLGPYTGPAYAGGTPVDTSALTGKLICGYQGWFRTPKDDDDTGWQHYIPDWGGVITPAKIAVDYWPEMAELTPEERHVADGFTHPDQSKAELFSSDHGRTVLRHFQWMEAYGIDGVAVQRFLPGASPDLPTLRVLSHVRAAANLTGRTFYVEYDMSGTPEADLVPTITRDWRYLVDTMKITSDPRYQKHGGVPVIGIFGFYEERFSAATAHAILDIFKDAGPYQAFVAGAGAWYWNVMPYSNAWKDVIYRMGSWQPWNTGNSGGKPGDVPNTAYWAADKAALAAHGVMYQPQIYPGGSDFNRSHKPWGPSTEDRIQGGFLWSQIAAATTLGASSVFLGMFDEIDEGTQIFKVSQAPPTEANFRDYQGLPSDAYLCFTGQGTKMIRGEIPFSAEKPDCAALTQPTIPDPVAPLNGDTVSGPSVTYEWTPALALAQGGTIDHYEVWLDGAITKASGTSMALMTSPGTHVWRVRAVNSLGNAGGFSVAQTFTASDGGSASSASSGSSVSAGGSMGGTGGATGGGGAAGGGGGAGGDPPMEGKGGCGCSMPGLPLSEGPLGLLSLLSWLMLARRRADRG